MTYEQIVEYYGSEAAAAKILQITRQAINLWKQTSAVPKRTQAYIQLKTRGKLKADKG